MSERRKSHSAVALQYQRLKTHAPKIVAKGRGKIADKIIALARENGVFIHTDPDLIEVLSQLDINDEIPPDLYTVVAELLAFVYAVNGGKKLQ